MTRTECDCRACTINCEHLPGHLIPSDLAAIRAVVPDLDDRLLASPGALVATRDGQRFRIPTLVPARKADGSCVFLTADKRCAIHAVAPAGCAFFDAHQSGPAVLRLSERLLGVIAADHAAGGPYAALHARLVATGRVTPPIAATRDRLRRAAEQEGID